MDDFIQPGSSVQSPTPIVEEKATRSGTRLAISLLILGVVVGAVGMWAFYKFIILPSAIDSRLAEEITRIKSEISAEVSDEQFVVSGKIFEIVDPSLASPGLLEDDGRFDDVGDNDFVAGEESASSYVTLILAVDETDNPNEKTVREMSLSFDQNTKLLKSNASTGNRESAVWADFLTGTPVAVKVNEAITNNAKLYYATEIIKL